MRDIRKAVQLCCQTQGRMKRTTYILATIIMFAISFALGFIFQPLPMLGAVVVALLLVYPEYTVLIRRIQDVTKPEQFEPAQIRIAVLLYVAASLMLTIIQPHAGTSIETKDYAADSAYFDVSAYTKKIQEDYLIQLKQLQAQNLTPDAMAQKESEMRARLETEYNKEVISRLTPQTDGRVSDSSAKASPVYDLLAALSLLIWIIFAIIPGHSGRNEHGDPSARI